MCTRDCPTWEAFELALHNEQRVGALGSAHTDVYSAAPEFGLVRPDGEERLDRFKGHTAIGPSARAVPMDNESRTDIYGIRART